MNPHEVTRAFEARIAHYTGAPYVICVDNASNALFLSLVYDDIRGKEITIPAHTYMSVPCEVIHAGGKVRFDRNMNYTGGCIKGPYPLFGSRVWDSALRFTVDMYIPSTFMCCSFTGPYKHLNLGKGGCILTDSPEADKWFRKAMYSGRNPVNYHEDNFTDLGWNFYMNPFIAEMGLMNIGKFYSTEDGSRIPMPDVKMRYPDLSQFPIYTQA
jgi:dTDP-4-amino-4,6-dideoxygalactose transaminase